MRMLTALKVQPTDSEEDVAALNELVKLIDVRACGGLSGLRAHNRPKELRNAKPMQ